MFLNLYFTARAKVLFALLSKHTAHTNVCLSLMTQVHRPLLCSCATQTKAEHRMNRFQRQFPKLLVCPTQTCAGSSYTLKDLMHSQPQSLKDLIHSQTQSLKDLIHS